MELAQEEKAARLEQAVMESSAVEIAAVYAKLGEVELTAPALGLACRFRGLAVVRALVENGATFDFPPLKERRGNYNYYIGYKDARYRTNYYLYLLSADWKMLRYALGFEGIDPQQGKRLEQGARLPDEERAAVLRYLLEKRDEISFQPDEMRFYALFFRDRVLYEAIKNAGIGFPGKYLDAIADGVGTTNVYWTAYVALSRRLADAEYLEVMQELAAALGGKPFHYTEALFDSIDRRLSDFRMFEFFFAHFNREKMNRTRILRCVIDKNLLDAMPLIEQEGWLGTPKKRDEMIAYASVKERTEMLAWLLDYKKRTADFAAEQDRADKKLMRDLNAAPDSVYALKKIWGIRKEQDGTLTITNYKGTNLEVAVPEKIGKSTVAAIGKRAFSGAYYHRGRAVEKSEHTEHHRTVTKIWLPGTIRQIGNAAFHNMAALAEINIPDGVKEIGEAAFSFCRSLNRICIPGSVEKIGEGAFGNAAAAELELSMGLREIGNNAFYRCGLKTLTIPGSVEKIGEGAFAGCDRLATVCICEGVQEIGACAFERCTALRSIVIPGTVRQIKMDAFRACQNLEYVEIGEGVEEIGMNAFFQCRSLQTVRLPASIRRLKTRQAGDCKSEVFDECPGLTVVCPGGSRAEAYCIRKNVRYQNCDGCAPG